MPNLQSIRALLNDESGAAVADYSIVLAVLSLAMLSAIGVMRSEVGANLSRTQTGYTGMSSSP